jgi:pantoate kinase
MNYDVLKDTLIAKIEQEFSEYKQNLIKNFTPEEIIEKSYETTFKEETMSILQGSVLSKNEIRALLNIEKVLETMYQKYMNIEISMLDKATDIVRDIVEDIDKEFMKNREKVR